MKVYFTVFVLTLLIQFYPIKTERQYLIRTTFSLVPLFLMLALRKVWGVDEVAYLDFFRGIHGVEDIWTYNTHMEVGYTWLNYILPTYQSLIVLTSLLTCSSYILLIYRYVPHNYSWIAVALIFIFPSLTIFFMLSAIRNGITASLLIFSCYFIEKRKIIPFALITVIAVSIHTSAIFVFPIAYLLCTNNPITKTQIVMLIFIFAFFIFGSLNNFISIITPTISDNFSRYENYLDELIWIADDRGYIGSLTGTLLATFVIVFILSHNSNPQGRLTDRDTKDNFMIYKLSLFYAFSFTMGSLSGRFGQYLIYFFIITIPCMFAYWKNRILTITLSLIVLSMAFYIYDSWISNPYFKYDIYTSILGDI